MEASSCWTLEWATKAFCLYVIASFRRSRGWISPTCMVFSMDVNTGLKTSMNLTTTPARFPHQGCGWGWPPARRRCACCPPARWRNLAPGGNIHLYVPSLSGTWARSLRYSPRNCDSIRARRFNSSDSWKISTSIKTLNMFNWTSYTWT